MSTRQESRRQVMEKEVLDIPIYRSPLAATTSFTTRSRPLIGHTTAARRDTTHATVH